MKKIANKHFVQVWLALLIVGAMTISGAGVALAADDAGDAGSGPGTAMSPSDGWVQLANGEKQWYAFRDEGDQSSISVRMNVTPGDRAFFEVLTPEQVNKWANGETFDPVGAGTKNADLGDDLYWTGSFVSSGTYYVVVTSRNFGDSQYTLSINGDDVSFPMAQVAAPQAAPVATTPEVAQAQPVAEPAMSIEEQMAMMTGSSADAALAPVGDTMQIASGQKQWYAFYDGGDGHSIQIRADVQPDSGLSFQVLTPAELRLWQQGMSYDPVGRGTENADLNADLFWTGSFVKGGTYYIVVEPSGLNAGPITYNLTVTGEDVSFQAN
jgi:hypothetical protein